MMIGRRVVLAIGVIVAIYVFSFACTFERFGDPVRSEDGQWLGPPKRINPTVTDIGKSTCTGAISYLRIDSIDRFASSGCASWVFRNRAVSAKFERPAN